MVKSILTIFSLAILVSCGNPDPQQGEKSSGSGDNMSNNEGERIIDTMATESNAGSQQDSTANHSTNESHSQKEHQTDIVDHDK